MSAALRSGYMRCLAVMGYGASSYLPRMGSDRRSRQPTASGAWRPAAKLHTRTSKGQDTGQRSPAWPGTVASFFFP